MYVIHTETGKQVKATISKLEPGEFVVVKKGNRFNFDWNKEKGYDVYKLSIGTENQILGLLSLHDRPADYAFEIRLLALSKENIGKARRYERIAGCLIAFACEQAFSAGYDGYVCLKPKTELSKHYQIVYGLRPTTIYLVTEGRNSLDLIKEYYENKTD